MAEDAENCSNSAMGGTWVKGGGRLSWPPLLHLQQASVLEGGVRGKGKQIRPCTRCSLHAFSFTLCLSFSYPRSAVQASFDTKKACRKGQCHEIFPFWFFSSISFPPAPEYPIRTVSKFFENSRRYSQLKVDYRCR